MMFGKMPVLFVDGEQIAHSRAAFRYLARIFKLEGGSDLIAAKIDVWVEIFIEALMKLPFTEKDEKIKVITYNLIWFTVSANMIETVSLNRKKNQKK